MECNVTFGDILGVGKAEASWHRMHVVIAVDDARKRLSKFERMIFGSFTNTFDEGNLVHVPVSLAHHLHNLTVNHAKIGLEQFGNDCVTKEFGIEDAIFQHLWRHIECLNHNLGFLIRFLGFFKFIALLT